MAIMGLACRAGQVGGAERCMPGLVVPERPPCPHVTGAEPMAAARRRRGNARYTRWRRGAEGGPGSTEEAAP